MSLLPDRWIQKQAIEQDMIHPFISHQVHDGVISYGLSSYGYDARMSDEFKIFTNTHNAIMDPKDFSTQSFVDYKGPTCVVPPNGFVLGRTMEYFKIPCDVLALCVGKSSYARCGIAVNVTPLEPGWEGQVTLEFSNTTPLPAKLYAFEGACQFLFLRGTEPCAKPYSALAGKYMHQKGITLSRMSGSF